MIKNLIDLLIIEDHTISAKAYGVIISNIPKISFNITFAESCDEALVEINNKKWDLVLLDLRIPVSKDSKYLCGEDLGILIRNVSPKTKIIVLTATLDFWTAYNIFKEFNPEGFLIKSDINSKKLILSVCEVINGGVFFSETIQNFLYENNFSNISIDGFDRQILYWLSMGLKTKDICNYIPLSHRTIEVRKSKLKEVLLRNDETTSLVLEAKKLKII